MQKKKCDMLISHLNSMGLPVLHAKRKLGNQNLKHLVEKGKGTSDTVEVKEKPATMPSPLQHCREKTKALVVLESDREQTDTPKLLEGLVKRINTVVAAASSTEKPVAMIRSSNLLSLTEITSLEDEKKPSEILDALEVKVKPSSTPSPLEDLCKKVKESTVIESNEKRTCAPKLLEGLVKWLDTRTSAASSTKKPVSLIRSTKPLSPDDIFSVQDEQFISDPIISLLLDNLMAYLWSKKIHDVQLVDPMVSYLMCRDPNDASSTAQTLDLPLSRLVLLPVNDNKDLNRAGVGKHWSLLVFDQWTQYGPRLVHYDSYGSSNTTHARNLADRISPYLPDGTTDMIEGETPQQGNKYDCGAYLMAIVACICEWCEHASASASAGRHDADWSCTMRKDVTADSVTSLRTWLRETLHR